MTTAPRANVVIVGLGNPLRSDDGVGLAVAQRVATRVDTTAVRVEESVRGGLDLLELLTGSRVAHIVDAIITDEAPPGHVWRLTLDQLPPSLTLASSHEVDLPTALELGAKLGYSLPESIVIWAIEVTDPYTLSESMSEPVVRAVAECGDRILRAL